jgi:hypothetical protein
MENRELKTMDEEKVTREAIKSSQSVWNNFQNQS